MSSVDASDFEPNAIDGLMLAFFMVHIYLWLSVLECGSVGQKRGLILHQLWHTNVRENDQELSL